MIDFHFFSLRLFSHLFACILLLGAITGAADSPETPNVLFITIDDLNDVPAFMGNNPDARTPNLDRLAGQGIWFSRAHSSYPLCGPSRASLMSGLSPTTLGFYGHMTNEELLDRVNELNATLLHKFFKKAGYKVFSVGKIYHLGHPLEAVDRTGGSAAFGEKEGMHYFHKRTSTDWGVPSYGDSDANFSDYENAHFAVELLKEAHDEPFLLMVGFVQPHVPWYTPQRYLDLYPDPDSLKLADYKENDWDDIPESAITTSIGEQYPRTDWAIEQGYRGDIMQAYLACVSFTDFYLGQVLSALEASPYADNTIVVLLSDHGYHLGEKNTYQKETLWERSSHVPLVFAGPGVKANQSSGAVVSLLDVYPTLIDLCGFPANPTLEGQSLRTLLENPEAGWMRPAVTTFAGDNHAVQSTDFRYIRWADGAEELYDHRIDPLEETNLADAEKYSDLKASLRKWIPAVRD